MCIRDSGTTMLFDNNVVLPNSKIFSAFISILFAVCLVIYMKKSKLGRAIRATAQNARAAKILGVDTEKVYAATFGINAALLVFKDAFERANSFDQKKVRDALAATDMQTFYGNIKFAPGGQNVDKPMVLFQVMCDDAGKCENKVVAPLKWASAKLIHPVPKWSER